MRAADMIAISPGIDRRTPVIAAAIRRGVPVVGDVELFARALRSSRRRLARKRAAVIAITGTNGKSTVTRMAGDICARGGLDTVVAGNIGTPVLDALTAIENGRRRRPTCSCSSCRASSWRARPASTPMPRRCSICPRIISTATTASTATPRPRRACSTAAARRCSIATTRAAAAMALPGRDVQRFGLDAPGTETSGASPSTMAGHGLHAAGKS